MRIAYLSPLPPQRSGIADYSFELLPHLAQLAELTLFVQDPGLLDDHLQNQFRIHTFDQFAAQKDEFDLALYHMGNSEYHDEITRLALEFPGVVVLHDFNLHHAVARRTIGEGDAIAYARELGYERGAIGVRRGLALKRGTAPPFFESPLNGRLLDTSLGIIVHSHYAANLARRRNYRGPLAIIPAPIAPITGKSRRVDLNLPKDAVLFGSFGLVTKEKQINNILHALRQLRVEMPQAHFLLVGGVMPDVAVQEVIRELSLDDVVHEIGYVADLADFIDWIQTADVVINLRHPTVGETSATALRALAAGKPLIVNDHGWYREIPSEAALKIAPENAAALLDAMRKTGQSKSIREQMGAVGLQFTHDSCRPDVVAGLYVQELRQILKTVGIYG